MTTSPAPVAAADRVTIRLYCGLLGDCFLLRFPRHDRAAPHALLIDFGVLLGMAEGAARVPGIAADIHGVTNGALDTVIVTHRHWDHLCGFGKAPEFADNIDELWMSWVEDPDDAEAQKLQDVAAKSEAGLAKLAAALHASPGARDDGAALDALLEFNGGREAVLAAGRAAASGDVGLAATSGAVFLAGGGASTVGLMNALRDRVAKEQRHYLKPGSVIAIPGTPVRVFVFGPPIDETLLHQQNPSADKHEVYKFAFADTAALADTMTPTIDRLMAAPGVAAASAPVETLVCPFDIVHGQPIDQAGKWHSAAYDDPALAWRQIGDAWLGSAEALAIKFDSFVNNTSLVLAFELEPGGDVMLFAADAQVGNWLSWATIATWSADIVTEFAGKVVETLLARTVFYKCGHHGSINATARDTGLELMTAHDELTAFIPVVETFARTAKKWDMPHAPLLARLEAKCGGGVFRGDFVPAVAKTTGTVRVTPSPNQAPWFLDVAL